MLSRIPVELKLAQSVNCVITCMSACGRVNTSCGGGMNMKRLSTPTLLFKLSYTKSAIFTSAAIPFPSYTAPCFQELVLNVLNTSCYWRSSVKIKAPFATARCKLWCSITSDRLEEWVGERRQGESAFWVASGGTKPISKRHSHDDKGLFFFLSHLFLPFISFIHYPSLSFPCPQARQPIDFMLYQSIWNLVRRMKHLKNPNGR